MKARDLKAHHKLALVLGAILFITAVSGYFMKVRQALDFSDETRDWRKQQERQLSETTPPAGEVPTAVPYREIQNAGLQPNADWQDILTSLPTEPAEPLKPKALSDTERRSVLAERSSRRSFDGAPPVVPHPIDQRHSSSCLICHGETQPFIGGQQPPRISHDNFASCTQCHVPASGPAEGFADLAAAVATTTAFAGKAALEKGSRAYPGAPPTLPHPTLRREDCMSCHGPGRAHALVTSHPERQACNQCHAPSADLDQRNFDIAGIRKAVLFEVRKPRPKTPATAEPPVPTSAKKPPSSSAPAKPPAPPSDSEKEKVGTGKKNPPAADQ